MIPSNKLLKNYAQTANFFQEKQELRKKVLDFCGEMCYSTNMNEDIIKNLKKVRQDLQAQISALTADLESVNRMLGRYEGQMSFEADYGILSTDKEETPTSLRFYVLKTLREKYPKSLRAGQIRKIVLQKGYISKAIKFEGAMFAMLSNLVKLGKIKKTGVGLYRALRPDVEKGS